MSNIFSIVYLYPRHMVSFVHIGVVCKPSLEMRGAFCKRVSVSMPSLFWLAAFISFHTVIKQPFSALLCNSSFVNILRYKLHRMCWSLLFPKQWRQYCQESCFPGSLNIGHRDKKNLKVTSPPASHFCFSVMQRPHWEGTIRKHVGRNTMGDFCIVLAEKEKVQVTVEAEQRL